VGTKGWAASSAPMIAGGGREGETELNGRVADTVPRGCWGAPEGGKGKRSLGAERMGNQRRKERKEKKV